MAFLLSEGRGSADPLPGKGGSRDRVGRALSGPWVEEFQATVWVFIIASSNHTMAKPCAWTSQGKALMAETMGALYASVYWSVSEKAWGALSH
jgi:hypothetical protein